MTLFCIIAILLSAGNPVRMLKEDPDRAGVNTHAYEFRELKETPAPKGYKPFYLSHYGRHGSRTDWGPEHYVYVIERLEKADSAGILNACGDSLLNEARIVLSVHDGMNGHLTRLGEEEHREIARRIYRRYPGIFKKGPGTIRVESSIIPRCLVSMANFTGELTRLQPELQFTIDSGEKQYSYINNDCSKAHRKASGRLLDSLVKSSSNDTVQIFKTLFTDPGAARKIIGDPDKFQKYIWYTARVARASGIKENVYRYLPEDVIVRWWDYFNRELYIRHGNSVEFGDLRMPLTVPLVKDIISKAEEAVSRGEIAADLKFGHDYPILALTGFFGLDGVGDRVSFNEIPQTWNDPMNIPFASNLQMVFYRNKSGDILVKFVYNDRERSVSGLEPASWPYYRWEDVKKYCESKIASYLP